MAKSAKQYRNVYTILEKVKKGELQQSGPSLFSRLDYRKRAELVKPYLHYIDENALKRSVQHFITQPASHQKLQQLAKTYNRKLVSPDTLSHEMIQIWNKFPKEVVSDIFNLYYHQIEKLQFEDHGPHNKMRYKFLEKSNNPVTKVITQGSNLKSMVFTRNMVQYMLMMLAMMQQENPDKFKDMMDQLKQQAPKGGSGQGQPQQGGGQGEGQPDPNQKPQPSDSQPQPGNGQPQPQSGGGASQPTPQQGGSSAGKGDKSESALQDQLEKMLQDAMNSAAGKQMMEQVLNDAKETVNMMENMMTEEEMKELWDNLGDGAAAADELDKIDKGKMSQMESELKQIRLNMTGVKEKIRKLLDKSLSFFHGREVPVYEGIFDADSLDGLQDYDLLHPCMRKFMIEDVLVKDVKRLGKIDIFVDVSGSMSSSSGVKDARGNHVSKLTFAKALTLKMKEMDLLNDVYTFQSSVRKKKGNTLFDIMTISGGGGTDLNRVVERIIQNGKNAIVITDAEDRCGLYSEHAYFIGVAGARFTSFNPDACKKYADNAQMIVFDGTSVKKVGSSGMTI